MSDLPKLHEADVRAYIYGAYFERGLGYYHQGNIFDNVRRGNRLEARCHGSMPNPYRVIAELGDEGIVWDDCSCPIGGGCKHVAALLLTWVHQPESFTTKEEVDDLLENKNKTELIALVQEMLKRAPELDILLDLPSVRGDAAGEPIDPEPYRRQVRNAFIGAEDWDTHFGVAEEIASIVDIGDRFLEAEEYHNAQTVYQVVVATGLENYERAYHDEGDILIEIGRAVDGLIACFETFTEDPVARRATMRMLFDILQWDIDMGGYDMSGGIPETLSQKTTEDERNQLRTWVEKQTSGLDGTDDYSRSWELESWGRFLLSLDEQDDTVDEFLERAASQGMHRIRFDKLVELGCVEQAVEVAVEHLCSSDHDFLNSALTLERAGYAQQAIAMVESKVDTIEHGRLLAWLANHYEASGDQVGALKLHLRRWEKDRPSLELYQTLEKLAESLDRWDELRPTLIAGLQANENRYVLVEVHLYEEAWDLAWQVAESESGQRWGWGQNFLEIVAQATEKQRPRRASDYYLRQVQSLADQRGRKNYAEAARYLLKVRQIYQDLGEPRVWAGILADIRERNDNLPAFQDELNKAGL